MIPYERRKKILSHLEKTELLYIDQLKQILKNASESTIRRDLKVLEEEGHVNLLTGGAAQLKTSSYEMPIDAKKHLHLEEKKRIAKHAASLINDGEVIYIDSGSTPLQMIEYIKNKKVEVFTSNTLILNKLYKCQFNCILIGGEVSANIGSTGGPIADNLLSDIFFDKAFLGASGYTLKSGINTPDIKEVNKKRIVKENSTKTYVLLDSSKAYKKTCYKVFDIDECIIITDEINEILEEKGNYILAK